ncbi:hypothetical protein CVT26_007327 [Gymnopilus dilepis]|uniref:Uncharacterized protein n=1 Tax=Gymnopilus dilepis TaxID=231916 RepID=A0A409W1L7_9AGAR|nr:hypothetical protein CVT26_007327 [Gymnopilus dilepis]
MDQHKPRYDPVHEAVANYTPPYIPSDQPITSVDMRHVRYLNPCPCNPCVAKNCNTLLQPRELPDHIREKHRNKWRMYSGIICPDETCPMGLDSYVFPTVCALYDHIKRAHWKLGWMWCPVCMEDCAGGEQGIVTHLRMEHPEVKISNIGLVGVPLPAGTGKTDGKTVYLVKGPHGQERPNANGPIQRHSAIRSTVALLAVRRLQQLQAKGICVKALLYASS